MILHAIGRGLLHFICAAWVLSWGFILLNWLQRKYFPKILPTIKSQLITVCILSPLVLFLREVLDVWRGDPVWKSYTDLLSWALGLVVSFGAERHKMRRIVKQTPWSIEHG